MKVRVMINGDWRLDDNNYPLTFNSFKKAFDVASHIQLQSPTTKVAICEYFDNFDFKSIQYIGDLMLYKVYEDSCLIGTYNTKNFALKDLLNVTIECYSKDRQLHVIEQSIASGEYEETIKEIYALSINLIKIPGVGR